MRTESATATISSTDITRSHSFRSTLRNQFRGHSRKKSATSIASGNLNISSPILNGEITPTLPRRDGDHGHRYQSSENISRPDNNNNNNNSGLNITMPMAPDGNLTSPTSYANASTKNNIDNSRHHLSNGTVPVNGHSAHVDQAHQDKSGTDATAANSPNSGTNINTKSNPATPLPLTPSGFVSDPKYTNRQKHTKMNSTTTMITATPGIPIENERPKRNSLLKFPPMRDVWLDEEDEEEDEIGHFRNDNKFIYSTNNQTTTSITSSIRSRNPRRNSAGGVFGLRRLGSNKKKEDHLTGIPNGDDGGKFTGSSGAGKSAGNNKNSREPLDQRTPAANSAAGGSTSTVNSGGSANTTPTSTTTTTTTNTTSAAATPTNSTTAQAQARINAVATKGSGHKHSSSKISLSSLTGSVTRSDSTKRLLSFIGGGGHKDDQPIQKSDISAPSNFVHTRHIDADYIKGSSADKQLLQSLSQGIKPSSNSDSPITVPNSELRQSQSPTHTQTQTQTSTPPQSQSQSQSHPNLYQYPTRPARHNERSSTHTYSTLHRHEGSMGSEFSTSTRSTRPVSVMSYSGNSNGTPASSASPSPALSNHRHSKQNGFMGNYSPPRNGAFTAAGNHSNNNNHEKVEVIGLNNTTPPAVAAFTQGVEKKGSTESFGSWGTGSSSNEFFEQQKWLLHSVPDLSAPSAAGSAYPEPQAYTTNTESAAGSSSAISLSSCSTAVAIATSTINNPSATSLQTATSAGGSAAGTPPATTAQARSPSSTEPFYYHSSMANSYSYYSTGSNVNNLSNRRSGQRIRDSSFYHSSSSSSASSVSVPADDDRQQRDRRSVLLPSPNLPVSSPQKEYSSSSRSLSSGLRYVPEATNYQMNAAQMFYHPPHQQVYPTCHSRSDLTKVDESKENEFEWF